MFRMIESEFVLTLTRWVERISRRERRVGFGKLSFLAFSSLTFKKGGNVSKVVVKPFRLPVYLSFTMRR